MSLVKFELPDWLKNISAEEINQKMLDNIELDVDKTEGGFVFDMTKPTALEKAELLEYWLPLALQANFHMWAKGIWLDYHAEDCGLSRRPATYAYGDLTVEGIAGTIIPKDFVFSVPSENGVAAIDFLTLEEITIPEEGTVTFRVQAVESGTNSNVAQDTIQIMKNPIKGITGITNPNNLTGGTVAESDDSLRQRIDDLFAGRADSYVGNKADYERWAKEVAGVGFAHCIPVYAGANTVKVVIMDSNGEPANQEICKAVELHIFGTGRDDINRLAPIGIVQYEVSPPILTEISYSFDLKLKENFTVEIVQKNFREALRSYYGELVESDGSVEPVVYVHVSAILSKVTGVADFKHLRINGKIGNVIFEEDEFPYTGEIAAVIYND